MAKSSTEAGNAVSLSALAIAFLKLGTIAFGGPAAHIAMMEDEFVSRRNWLSRDQFLDRLAMANLMPGPSSTELAIFIGYEKRGLRGLLVAGCCFILPAALIVGLIAGAYVRYGTLPQVNGLLYGVKPVVIAIVIQAVWKLTRSALKTALLACTAVISVILYSLHVPVLAVLVIAGILAGAPAVGTRAVLLVPQALTATLAAVAATTVVPARLWRVFLEFAKIGAVLFGSGYVLLVFLRADLVNALHWISERQLLDAIAVGQVTPGPVFTTATFIGYLVGGASGAVFATLGIFAPGFIFVAISGMLIPKIRKSAVASSALDGVAAGSLALMAAVSWQLTKAAIVDAPTAIIALVSAVCLLALRVNSVWLIAAAAAFGAFYAR